jgi:hypothetical protein
MPPSSAYSLKLARKRTKSNRPPCASLPVPVVAASSTADELGGIDPWGSQWIWLETVLKSPKACGLEGEESMI